MMEDNGRRVKSGYTFVSRPNDLQREGNMTYHRSLYNRIFRNIEDYYGVVIVGLSQQDNTLKGTSGTLNQQCLTTLVPDRPRDCMFIFRTLIFGSIIMYKLSGTRNVSPFTACLCICLFLIAKNQGDPIEISKFPIKNLELADNNVFTREMFAALGVESRILDVACNYGDYTWMTRWARVKYVMIRLMTGLKSDITEEEFRATLRELANIYGEPSPMHYIIMAIIRIFFPTITFTDFLRRR